MKHLTSEEYPLAGVRWMALDPWAGIRLQADEEPDDAEEEDDDEDEESDEDPKAKTPPKKPEKTFTQRQLNRLLKREKEAGRRAAVAELAKEAGISVDEVKKRLTKSEPPKDSDQGDEDKNRSSSRDSEDAKREREAAQRERHMARLERIVARKHRSLTDDEVEVLAIKVDREVDVGADEEEIQEVLDELKERMPRLFSTSKSDEEGEEDDDEKPKKKRATPSSDPKKGPPRDKTDKSAFERGRERAKQRGRGAFGGYPAEVTRKPGEL